MENKINNNLGIEFEDTDEICDETLIELDCGKEEGEDDE